MVKQEILDGLKESVSRGETLRNSMMSFLNAGYKKVDIEEAARTLMMHSGGQAKTIQPGPREVQPVSSYHEQKLKRVSKETSAKIVVSGVIVMLVVLLVGMIAFRNPIIGYINGLFV